MIEHIGHYIKEYDAWCNTIPNGTAHENTKLHYAKGITVSREYDTICFRNEAGIYHRPNGPAIIGRNSVAYVFDGKYHRENGPAIIRPTVNECWVRGVRHNLNGPSYIRKCALTGNLKKQWHIHGIHVDKTIFQWTEEMGINLNKVSKEEELLFMMQWGDK